MTYPHYDTFTKFMEKYVKPRNYGPNERLDQRDSNGNRVQGRAPKGNSVPAATFEYQNKIWDVHLDTHVHPLNIAFNDITQGHNDPFQRKFSRRHGMCLVLRADLWPTKTSKHLYIYEVQGPGIHKHVYYPVIQKTD